MMDSIGEQTQLQTLITWLDEQSLRERLLIVGLALAAIVVIWSELLMSSVSERKADAVAQLEPVQSKIRGLNIEIEGLARRVKIDPNEVKRETLTEIAQTLENTSGALVQRTAQLIPPSEMTKVVRELLSKESSLALLHMETLEPEPLLEDDKELQALEGGPLDALYKHSVEIELSGDYPSTLRWLEAVETIGWRFFWDELEYDVEAYPTARIRVVLHSLSSEEDWIGG